MADLTQEQQAARAVALQRDQAITVGNQGVEIRSLADLERFANWAYQSGLIPEGFKSAAACVVAMQMGAELGLPPMASLQNIAVINGRPSIWGDAALAVCQNHPDFLDIDEEFDDKTETATCKVYTKRRGMDRPIIRTWSKGDNITAGLEGGNVHKKFPKRMKQMRARSWALKDAFPGALKGLLTGEEAQELQPTRKTVENIPAPIPGQSKADALVAKLTAAETAPVVEQEPEIDPSIRRHLMSSIQSTVESKGMTGPQYDEAIAATGIADFDIDTADNDTLELVLEAMRGYSPSDNEPPADFYDEQEPPPFDEPEPEPEPEPVVVPTVLKTGVTKAAAPTPAAPENKARNRAVSAVMGLKAEKKVSGRAWNTMLTEAGSLDYKVENLSDDQLDKLLDALEALA